MYTVFKEATFTTRPGTPSSSGYIEVFLDGEMISRHRNPEEATESAFANVSGRGPGKHTFEFRYPNKILEVELEEFQEDVPPANDVTYIAEAPAGDSVHPDLQAGDPVIFEVVSGDVEYRRNGSTRADTEMWTVRVNGSEVSFA